MLERWIVASLIIGALIGARLVLRRIGHPPTGKNSCDSTFDACMTSGCKALRSHEGAKQPDQDR